MRVYPDGYVIMTVASIDHASRDIDVHLRPSSHFSIIVKDILVIFSLALTFTIIASTNPETNVAIATSTTVQEAGKSWSNVS